MSDIVFELKKLPLDGAGYEALADINNGQQRFTDNFVNIAAQDSREGGPSRNIAHLIAAARATHRENLSRLPGLDGTSPEFHYCTILCRRADRPNGDAFPIINAIEGYARHDGSGAIVPESRFLGLLFASHIRDAYREFLDHAGGRDPETEQILNILATAPFAVLGLPKPLFMISRRNDAEKNPLPTKTEAFFNSLGMSAIPHRAFVAGLGGDAPEFRYLTFEHPARTVVSPDPAESPTAHGFTAEQIALVTAIGWPLFAAIQTHLYDPARWPDLPLYDHQMRIEHTGLQMQKAIDWLNAPGMHEAILRLGRSLEATPERAAHRAAAIPA